MRDDSRTSFDGGCCLIGCGCLSGGCLGMVLVAALTTGAFVYGLEIGMISDPRDYAYVYVEGDEMAPAIRGGDWVLVDRKDVGGVGLERGELVWIEPPERARRTGKLFLRVAGLPGETVSFSQEGALILPDEVAQEVPFAEQDYRLGDQVPETVRLQENEFYLLGENPALAKDSRQWGPVPMKCLRGKARAILFPPQRIRQFQPSD